MNHSLFSELEAEMCRELAVRKERCRRLRNAFVLAGLGIVLVWPGVAFNVPLLLIPGMKWVTIAVFFAVVYGLQKMVFKYASRGAGWVWWLHFTFVMGYFIAPMIRSAVWGDYSDETLLVAILGLCGVVSWLFVTVCYARLTPLDLFWFVPEPGKGITKMGIIFPCAYILQSYFDIGTSLGALYPLLATMGWIAIISACFAAWFGWFLIKIKKPYGVAGLVWLLLFITVTGYLIGSVTDIGIFDKASLSYDIVLCVLGLMGFVANGYFHFRAGYYSYSKVDIASIGVLAVLLNLMIY